MEQYHHETAVQDDSTRKDVASVEKWKSVSSVVDGPENSHSGGFDCNICLDFVHDPVITLCGHLYCWPCIYKWIHFQNVSSENPQCPVCKAEVSQKTIVPLYGRGKTTKFSKGKAPNLGIVIPRRPPSPSCVSHALIATTHAPTSRPALQPHNRNFTELPQAYYPHPHSYTATLGGTSMTNVVHPMVGIFGEIVNSWIFGNSETSYAYPNSYHLVGNTSPRLRRHVMQADKSLSRICFFFCCCVVLCLLLF